MTCPNCHNPKPYDDKYLPGIQKFMICDACLKDITNRKMVRLDFTLSRKKVVNSGI